MINTPTHNLEKLKEGFLFWNKYRHTIKEQVAKIDLSNLQINGDHWRHNELKNAELNNCSFKNTSFRDIDFLDVDFSKSDFSNAQFSNVHFINCKFSENTVKNVNFIDTSWYNSSIDDLEFSEPNFNENIRFFKCSFNNDPLKKTDIPKHVFEDCKFNCLKEEEVITKD